MGPDVYTYISLSDYIIDQLWGFQQANLIKNNIRYAVDDKLQSLLALRIPRPQFYWNSADTSQIIIPGSSTRPSIVKIGTQYYQNTTDLTIDLDTAGANGLDTGAKAADTLYYVYAILPASGSAFRGTISVTAPTTGPTGFGSNWSYLGSFSTNATSGCNPFIFTNGVMNNAGASVSVTTNSSVVSAKTLKVPITATMAYGRLLWVAINGTNSDFSVGPTSTTTIASFGNPGTTIIGDSIYVCMWLVITEPQTFYAKVTTTTLDSIDFFVKSWIENPMDFQ